MFLQFYVSVSGRIRRSGMMHLAAHKEKPQDRASYRNSW